MNGLSEVIWLESSILSKEQCTVGYLISFGDEENLSLDMNLTLHPLGIVRIWGSLSPHLMHFAFLRLHFYPYLIFRLALQTN